MGLHWAELDRNGAIDRRRVARRTARRIVGPGCTHKFRWQHLAREQTLPCASTAATRHEKSDQQIQRQANDAWVDAAHQALRARDIQGNHCGHDADDLAGKEGGGITAAQMERRPYGGKRLRETVMLAG